MAKPTGLLSILAASEKRKDTLLLLLNNGPKTLSDINDYFDIKSPEILHHLKKMEVSNLIVRQNGIYYLTSFGRVLTTYFEPFLDTIQAIETNDNFWKMHDCSAIPEKLMYRLKELKDCKVIESEDYNINESHVEWIDNTMKATKLVGAACIFRSSWIKLILNFVSENVPVDIILLNGVYDKIKKEYPKELTTLLKTGNAHIRVCEKLNTSFTVTDEFFSLSLNYKTGPHDTKYDLMGFDQPALKWGNDLFNYYKDNSIEIIKPLDDIFIQGRHLQYFSTQL